MKIGDKIDFYLFDVKRTGEVYKVNKQEKTVGIVFEGYKYPGVRTFKKLPKNKKEIPPWYIYQ